MNGLRIPGKTNPIEADQVIDGTKNFTWGEALHGLTRVPPTSGVTKNIILVARRLQVLRDRFGKPIVVQSWYRDPESNKAAGGVENSEHLTGGAVDWHFAGLIMGDVIDELNAEWGGGLGFYGDWVHTDVGPYARWGM